MKYINVNKELPKNCFNCAVLVWNKFNDDYAVGVGIYDVPNKKWEITTADGSVGEIKYWVKLPEIPN